MHSYLVKLVRDRIGENSLAPGVKFRPIEDHEEFIEKLREKLMEEATEYLLKPSVSELGDIVAVVKALSEHDLGLGWDVVLETAQAKQDKRGAFNNRIGMYVEEEEQYT